jgi:hypothetical protein
MDNSGLPGYSRASKAKQPSSTTAGVNLSGSIDNSTQTVLVANNCDLESLQRLLKKFPTTEMESRLVKDSDWKDSLFILRKDGDTELITFPKNMDSFADNLFMISLLRLAVLKKWTIQLSSKELDVKVFDSVEGPFFAGFIAGACLKETGTCIKGSTRYSKGVASFQSFSVEKKIGKHPWLRTGGMDNLLSRLSGMKGFTKEYWGLRGTLAAIFKTIVPIQVTDLETYFLPKSEVMKHIRTKLPYENGGLFRSEEIAFLSQGYSTVKEQLNAFLVKLDQPTQEFAENFVSEYTPIKTAIENIDKQIRLLAVNRSKILFPQGNKKGIKKFKAMSLEDKLEVVSDDKPDLFLPESLPRISRTAESNLKEGSSAWRTAVYGEPYNHPLVKDIVDSWYTKFYSDE